MAKYSCEINGKVLQYDIADNFILRFIGLLITKCNQIHTFNMHFNIDAVYLDQVGKVVHMDKNISPRKICHIQRNAHSILELNSGAIDEYNILPDMILSFETYDRHSELTV